MKYRFTNVVQEKSSSQRNSPHSRVGHIVAMLIFAHVVSIVPRQRASSDVFFGDDVDRVPKHNSRTPVTSIIQLNNAHHHQLYIMIRFYDML